MSFIFVIFGVIIIANVKIHKIHQPTSSFLEQIASSERKNVYVEMRKWKAIWGITFDSQKEINLLLNVWNEKNYKCIHYQMGIIPNINILKLIWIMIVFVISLGSIQYWTGPTFLFENKEELK